MSQFFNQYGDYIIWAVILTIIGIGMYYSDKEDKEKQKLQQLKTSKEVEAILKNSQLYSKDPILRYRDMITTEKYKNIFDKTVSSKKYEKILNSLKKNPINGELLHLAMKLRSKEPDIQKKVEEHFKK